MERALASDADVIAYDETTTIQKMKVDVLKAAVDECKQRGYSIKGCLADIIFKNGG